MKTTKLIYFLFMILAAAKSFATFDSSAVVCNYTKSTDFNFQLNYHYQADVIGDDSYKFTLSHGTCHTIHFWMREDSSYETDDDLMFTDQSNLRNSFHIKAISDWGADQTDRFSLRQFDMPGFSFQLINDGKTYNDPSSPGGVYNQPVQFNIINSQVSSAPIHGTAIRFW
jgi:hypothetical protein